MAELFFVSSVHRILPWESVPNVLSFEHVNVKNPGVLVKNGDCCQAMTMLIADPAGCAQALSCGQDPGVHNPPARGPSRDRERP